MENKKVKIAFIVIVLIMATSIIGWMIFQKKQSDNNTAEILRESAKSDSLLKISNNTRPERDDNDVSKWGTYKNAKLGFEVKYPKSMHIISIKDVDGKDGTSIVSFNVKTSSKKWNNGAGEFAILKIEIKPTEMFISEYSEKGLIFDPVVDAVGQRDGRQYVIVENKEVPNDYKHFQMPIDIIKSTFIFTK